MTSLDPHYDLPLNAGLWQASARDPTMQIAKIDNTIGQDVKVREKVDLAPITKENLSSERAEERTEGKVKLSTAKKVGEGTVPLHEVLDKLRWASIGLKYHVRILFLLTIRI